MIAHNPHVESKQIILVSEAHVSPCSALSVPLPTRFSRLQQGSINYVTDNTEVLSLALMPLFFPLVCEALCS